MSAPAPGRAGKENRPLLNSAHEAEFMKLAQELKLPLPFSGIIFRFLPAG